MPVPRRFDRLPPERDTTRVNERIRVPEVRLIDENGAQVGIIKTPDALRYANDRDLDLVEVAPNSRPPVCRILDYSKYKYEQAQKQKSARKHQQQITIREIKFRPKIAQHDYDTKKNHIIRFLNSKDKVKVTIMFRGREVAHPERGEAILVRLADELDELAIVEQRPTQDGRNMTMMLAPGKIRVASEESSESKAKPVEDKAKPAQETESTSTDSSSKPSATTSSSKVDSSPATTTSSSPDSTPDSTTEPTPDSTTEPTPDSTTEPTPDSTTEPTPDSTTEPTPDSTTEQPTEGTSNQAIAAADSKAASDSEATAISNSPASKSAADSDSKTAKTSNAANKSSAPKPTQNSKEAKKPAAAAPSKK